MTDVAICRQMGWSYEELMSAPAQFVESVKLLLEKEALIQQEQERLSRVRKK